MPVIWTSEKFQVWTELVPRMRTLPNPPPSITSTALVKFDRRISVSADSARIVWVAPAVLPVIVSLLPSAPLYSSVAFFDPRLIVSVPTPPR